MKKLLILSLLMFIMSSANAQIRMALEDVEYYLNNNSVNSVYDDMAYGSMTEDGCWMALLDRNYIIERFTPGRLYGMIIVTYDANDDYCYLTDYGQNFYYDETSNNGCIEYDGIGIYNIHEVNNNTDDDEPTEVIMSPYFLASDGFITPNRLRIIVYR